MRRRRTARAAEPPFWLARLRWRIRGRSAWLALTAGTVAGAVLLEVLPPTGDPGLTGTRVAALLGVGVVLVAVGGAVGSSLLRRRDPTLPRLVARDRAATGAVGIGLLALAVGGILHRPAIVAERARIDGMVAEARALAKRRAPDYAARRLDQEDVRRLPLGILRVCFPLGRPDRAWCAIVRRDAGVPRARADSDPRSNAQAATETDDGS